MVPMFSFGAYAQEGFGTASPNKDAAVDLTSTNKGLLLPRIALTALTLATPLSANVTGMLVYNTATNGSAPNNVFPGVYFNDGSKWVRFNDNSNLPWNNVTTGVTATNETQDIYQSANVGIGVGNSTLLTNRLQLQNAAGDPIKTEGLNASPNTNAEKILVSNATTGVVNWIDFSAIKTASYRSIISQNINNNAFGPTSSTALFKQVLTFAATDIVVAPSFMSGGTDGIFTITDGGLFDIVVGASLSVPPSSLLENDATIKAITVNFNIEKLIDGTWTSIANTRTMIDSRAGDAGSSGVMSLTPLNVALKLVSGDQIRFIVQRANSAYLRVTTPQAPANTMKFIADASKGVPFSKTLRMVRLQ